MSSHTIRRARLLLCAFASLIAVGFASSRGFAHGDVVPQPVDTTGLPALGAGWLTENPYSGNALAVKIGSSGYNQNCARCHGLEVISGGLAPDLRYLDKGKEGDEWFIQRIRHGARKADGSTMMPPFEGILSQEAMWAIRTFLVSKAQDN